MKEIKPTGRHYTKDDMEKMRKQIDSFDWGLKEGIIAKFLDLPLWIIIPSGIIPGIIIGSAIYIIWGCAG